MTAAGVEASHRTARGVSIEVSEGSDGHHVGLTEKQALTEGHPSAAFLRRATAARPG